MRAAGLVELVTLIETQVRCVVPSRYTPSFPPRAARSGNTQAPPPTHTPPVCQVTAAQKILQRRA
jgi:hypothetical protein